MKFEIKSKDGAARTCIISTVHGEIKTPAFMPVGTAGSVKTLENKELDALGADIILSNAYHLYLRPGTETLQQLGGLHKFMGWNKPILIDSGGYQVLSLAARRKVEEEGVRFQSHIDGSYHLFTPEKVIEIQRSIGADFIMPLDELVGYPVEKNMADDAAQRTWRWLERSFEAFNSSTSLYDNEQVLIPIVQGSFYNDLRQREAERLASLEAEAYAIGGLAIGEAVDQRQEAIDISVKYLPENKPRYAMGIGLPQDLLDSIGRGIDLFDCVVPTRNGRNATLFTPEGRLNLRNAKFASDENPIEDGCPCPCCTQYSRAYLHHLYKSKEILALKLGSAHNLSYYFRLMEDARMHIEHGDFANWMSEIISAS
ncbi:MAG: tRNA guanosine(34) transglycosylase Tgt [Candidatus Electryonea clarkiae]|nr:tRNA guanosine(34) transglycosylase Tgt [Candidatus Electryonea clarkiae]MDP8288713.1 tRNA guanosine(34) transglycosylase Tgt [Candidatus Electryonea clarkiae]